MKRIATTILLLSSLSALAADYPRDITLDWVNAEQYEDGSLIEAGDLTQVRVECYRNSEPSPTFEAIVPASGVGLPQQETFGSRIPQPGTYTCYGFSIVYDGTESDPSNPATRKYVGKPFPPQTFK